MKWFIIVLMMGTHPDGLRDFYWYQEPQFQTVEECQTYVEYNSASIKMQMQFEFGPLPIDSVYCVREDNLTIIGVPESI